MVDEDKSSAPPSPAQPAGAESSAQDLRQQLLSQRLAASTETANSAANPALKRGARDAREAAKRPGPGRAALPPPPAARAHLDQQIASSPGTPTGEASPPTDQSSGTPVSTETVGAAGSGAERVPWDPRKLRQFMAGTINLGELEGINRDQQYDMATIGHQLLAQGKLTDAEQIFRGLTALNPSDAYFQLALGAVHQRKEELVEAEAAYTRALALHPKNSPALANRGEIRILAGRLVDGAKDLNDAVLADPEARLPTTKRALTTLSILRAQVQQQGDGR